MESEKSGDSGRVPGRWGGGGLDLNDELQEKKEKRDDPFIVIVVSSR